jgi:hypothetical protein
MPKITEALAAVFNSNRLTHNGPSCCDWRLAHRQEAGPILYGVCTAFVQRPVKWRLVRNHLPVHDLRDFVYTMYSMYSIFPRSQVFSQGNHSNLKSQISAQS